ncbi:hypothetical protein NM208_g9715 [Fusarium decemcellulare]|uniref:Uncharacterized protein n=1 Tax=Fusarium decemcellulare TaxID=57161 RepID=A0ACC1S0I1_9HYPO|nr:hypothetical protein NM208_g9715 [Fusarium decemcellulare]
MDPATIMPDVCHDMTTKTTSERLERIGMGFCGSVWADMDSSNADTASCMKREDGGPGRSLTNEYRIHKLVNQAVSLYPQHATSFSIPVCHGFLNKSDKTPWSEILPRLPPGSLACNALLSQKVQPVSETARRLLASIYAQGHDTETIVGDKKNEHCLIRPYFGRRRHRTRRAGKPTFFSLRNFPLHVDQMEELGISTDSYVKAMAEGLAFLLWVARVDANDVEFVLGRPPSTMNSESGRFDPGILGPHAMWIIDFDCCNQLPMDGEGVEIAARCFWRNDPFYPRPGSSNTRDEQLWNIFRDHFIQVSEAILQDELPSARQLPRLLTERIIETRGMYDKGVIT